MTQKQRVLELARRRGQNGFGQTDFLGPTADGGKPILRVAARVQDLEEDGHEFTVVTLENRTALYVLTRDAEVVPVGETVDADPGAETLFAVEHYNRRPLGAYEDAA